MTTPLASYSGQDYVQDKLFGGPGPFLSRKITLLSGQNLTRGAVLGKISLGAASSAAKAGNTGNGVLTLDATTPVRPGAKAGVYVVRCIAAAVNGGTFRVEDPDGVVLGDVAVAATFDDDIKFSIADGATDFVVGDGFDVTIAAGSGKYQLAAAAAIDGSAEADLILAETSDATAGDKLTAAYESGQFAEAGLTLGAGHTADSVREMLRKKGIHLVPSQTA